jgi:hypothetical protein
MVSVNVVSRSVRSRLVTLAFAGFAVALLARGIILILMAPKLAAGVGSGGAAVAQRLPPRGERPRSFAPFPQLAPEKQEIITPLGELPATALDTTPKAPFVPLNGALVVGITWSTDPDLSLASIVYNNEHSLNTVHGCEWMTVEQPEGPPKQVPRSPCNQIAEGYLVREIRRYRVKVEHVPSGTLQDLDLFGDGKPVNLAALTAAPPAVGAPAEKGKGSAISQMMDNVKQVGPNHWESPPGMREDVLGRLSEVAMEGRWLPFFENGKITGFKLAQTVGNSAFEKIGLKAGDVIKSVNGNDISSPDKILEVFTKLRDARDISVDIQRGESSQKGAKQSLKYTIN